MESTITNIDCAVVRMPLAEPVALATRRVVSRDWLVTIVTTKDGNKGLGFTYAGYEAGEVIGSVLEKLVAPFYLGKDSDRPDILHDTTLRQLGIQNGGLVARAVSALDIALWDRNAVAADLPLYKFIGGSKTSLDTYVGGGYYKENDSDFEQLKSELQRYLDTGYSAVKIKVGKFDPKTEGRRARICREVLGSNIDLVIDANGKFESIEAFGHYVSEYSSIDPIFFEDPFPSHMLSLYETLGPQTPIPLSTGELLSSVDDFERLAKSKTVSILQVDSTTCGGVTAFKRIAKIASQYGISLETHWFPEFHAHLAMSEETVKRIEVFHDQEIINFSSLLKKRVVSNMSSGLVSECPGIGLVLDNDVVEKHCIFSVQLAY